jgi:hypothetical protein
MSFGKRLRSITVNLTLTLSSRRGDKLQVKLKMKLHPLLEERN